MPNVQPLSRESLAEFEPYFKQMERALGFVPNSLFTMAHRPDILRGFWQLMQATLVAGTVDVRLKQLVAMLASNTAGCRYCEAHTSSRAAHLGVDSEKVRAVYEFETSSLFSAAERAALRLARDGAILPNATTPEHFEDLREHFTDAEVVELVGVLALFGWLNRWNDTMGTELEALPRTYGERELASSGWEVGKHR